MVQQLHKTFPALWALLQGMTTSPVCQQQWQRLDWTPCWKPRGSSWRCAWSPAGVCVWFYLEPLRDVLCSSLIVMTQYALLYTLLLVQRNCWFANSDVPFQSVTNDLLHGQFAMPMYALHQVDVTSELSHSGGLRMHRAITKQLMYSSVYNIRFVCTSFWSSWYK